MNHAVTLAPPPRPSKVQRKHSSRLERPWASPAVQVMCYRVNPLSTASLDIRLNGAERSLCAEVQTLCFLFKWHISSVWVLKHCLMIRVSHWSCYWSFSASLRNNEEHRLNGDYFLYYQNILIHHHILFLNVPSNVHITVADSEFDVEGVNIAIAVLIPVAVVLMLLLVVFLCISM